MPRERVIPETLHQPASAAAMVVTLGNPQLVNPMWSQLAGNDIRPVLDCRLRVVKCIDFYPPYGGSGSGR